MDLGLRQRTVIVTGASGGIGQQIAAGFAAEGANVVCAYHSASEQAAAVAANIGDHARVAPYTLGDPRSAAELVEFALHWTGRVDVLVNNARADSGGPPSPDSPFEHVSDDVWRLLLASNVNGAVDLARKAAPVMREQGFGRMVHISSGLVVEGMAGAEYYTAAKAALHGFSRSAAFSLGRDGDILSNIVMPGLTRTAVNADRVARIADSYAAKSAIGRLLDAAEIARTVVYLGSAANTGVTGQALAVTGGA